MALIAATHLLTNGDDTSKSTYTTASVSPSANKLILLAVTNNFSSSPNAPTVTGASLTWTQVATKLDSVPTRRITVFRALTPNPGSGTLSIDFAGQSQTSCSWSLSEFSNVDRTGTNGANAIIQNASAEATGTNTGVTVTLGAFSNSNNATYGAVRAGAAVTITVGSGFTELGQYVGASSHLETEWKNSNDTTVDWTWASTSLVSVAIALELKWADPSGAAIFF